MIRTISPQDMREMERAFLEGTGYPSILLMEHAAQAVVDALSAYAKAGSRVLFVCGSGNNGGDGCAAARLWMQRGGQADVWLLKSPSQMKGDAGVNGCLLNSCGAPLNVLYSEAPEVPGDCAAIVDALYGTGLSRELDGAALSAVRRINESGLPSFRWIFPPAWTVRRGRCSAMRCARGRRWRFTAPSTGCCSIRGARMRAS